MIAAPFGMNYPLNCFFFLIISYNTNDTPTEIRVLFENQVRDASTGMWCGSKDSNTGAYPFTLLCYG